MTLLNPQITEIVYAPDTSTEIDSSKCCQHIFPNMPTGSGLRFHDKLILNTKICQNAHSLSVVWSFIWENSFAERLIVGPDIR